MTAGWRRLLWAGAGLFFSLIAVLLVVIAERVHATCFDTALGGAAEPLLDWLRRYDLRDSAFYAALGLAPFLWHFGLGAAIPGMLRTGSVVMTLLWVAAVLGPLCFPGEWHDCDRKGSDAGFWLLTGAIFAFPAFVVTLLFSRLAFDWRPR